MENKNMRPLDYQRMDEEQMCEQSIRFFNEMKSRRTVRDFSSEDVPDDVIRNAIRAAATAPNGANLQGWHFVIVRDQAKKDAIRQAAEQEEYEFYNGRAPQDWLDTLAPLGTNESKPFLSEAPVLIGIFSERYRFDENGNKQKIYYPTESTGIATGMLITALHLAGLSTLTHTPSPMGFMNEIMERPSNERPFLLLVAGYPKSGALVPDISKREFSEICTEL